MPQLIEVPGFGEVEFPDGMTDEQISSAIKKNMAPATPTAAPVSKVQQFARGAMDPVTGLSQLAYHSIPKSFQEAGNRFNNWLADKGLPFDKIPESGFDTLLAQDEAQYQAGRQAAGSEGIDWTRLAGNVLSPANLAVASKIPVAASAAGRIGTGAATGALFSSAQPVNNTDEFWTEKAKQAGLGAVTGGVLSAAGEGLSRLVSPAASRDPKIQQLLNEGVKPTPGQLLGGKFRASEEKLSSVPFVGDTIREGQRKVVDQFNRAAYTRALKPIGSALPKELSSGRKALEYTIDKLDDAYDDILPKIGGKIDDGFLNDIVGVQSLGKGLPDVDEAFLSKVIDNEIINKFTGHGLASGETVKEIQSALGEYARNASAKGDMKLSGAFMELKASLGRMIERNNPNYAKTLANINKGYANLLRVQRAAGALGAQEGVFTPAQLLNSVKAMDKSFNKRQFATGKALMQDLAEAGKSTLSQTVPNSGTFDRAALAYLMTNPVKGTGAIAGGMLASAPYSDVGRSAMAGLLARRPDLAQPIAEAIQRGTLLATPASVPMGYSLLNEAQ